MREDVCDILFPERISTNTILPLCRYLQEALKLSYYGSTFFECEQYSSDSLLQKYASYVGSGPAYVLLSCYTECPYPYSPCGLPTISVVCGLGCF
jgi:hypothetical protein